MFAIRLHVLFSKPGRVCSVQVEIDDLIQDLLVLPPGTDLHVHPLVLNGSIVLQVTSSCAHIIYVIFYLAFHLHVVYFIFAPYASITRFAVNLSIEVGKFMTPRLFIGQGKASCMPAQALAPDYDWEVHF